MVKPPVKGGFSVGGRSFLTAVEAPGPSAKLREEQRAAQPTIPPAVTYGITERMKDIEKVLHQLEGLARKWQGQGAKVGAKSLVVRASVLPTNPHA